MVAATCIEARNSHLLRTAHRSTDQSWHCSSECHAPVSPFPTRSARRGAGHYRRLKSVTFAFELTPSLPSACWQRQTCPLSATRSARAACRAEQVSPPCTPMHSPHPSAVKAIAAPPRSSQAWCVCMQRTRRVYLVIPLTAARPLVLRMRTILSKRA